MDRALGPRPSVLLAHVPGAQGDNVLLPAEDRIKPVHRTSGVAPLPPAESPALLVSYVFLRQFRERQSRYIYRDWVLDSGAFSAYASGTVIDLEAYADTCLELLATDPTLTEVYSLDVIGDWQGSARNTERLWARGVPAIPTYHVGEPWDVLDGLARDYPKIAIGGIAYARGAIKLAFARQCFARVWPKRIHGFGCAGERMIMALPFHSADATNWEIGPCKFGNWRSLGKMSVRGSQQNLRSEVAWYLNLERRARERWRPQMAQLEAEATTAPAVRLAVVTTGTRTDSALGAGGGPSA